MLYEWIGVGDNAQRTAVASTEQRDTLRRIATALGPQLRETETARQWLYVNFFAALYHAQRGARGPALAAIGSAQALFPREPDLLRLQRAVLHANGTPVDTSAFLRHADPSQPP